MSLVGSCPVLVGRCGPPLRFGPRSGPGPFDRREQTGSGPVVVGR